MGLLQKAVETYDANLARVGVEYDGKPTLAPVAHLTTSANIIITLDGNGKILNAETVDKKAAKVIIPVTSSSAGRTSGISAHPLCEQLKYLAEYKREKAKDEACYSAYVKQLSDWVMSEYNHPKLEPILTYVKSGTILKDLERFGIIKCDDTGAPENEKLLIIWRVVGIGEASGDCWTDATLFDSFIKYYEKASSLELGVVTDMDMVSGNKTVIAEQHPKGVIALYGNAKLISSNDNANFTYRGRFTEAKQAATIGSISSQKSHNALKWLAAGQGIFIGGRTFICWTPKVLSLPNPFESFMSVSEDDKPLNDPSDYREQLYKLINSYKAAIPEEEGVMIAAFDAATTGRLSLTYYNELTRSDFLDRLGYWDETCCWTGKSGISSPNLKQIIKCAFGTERESNGGAFIEADDKIMREHIQRLLSCRIDMAGMPKDIMESLFKNAGNPLSYSEKNRRTLNFTACAVIRKYNIDRFGKEYKMALEPEKKDLSYQYGRLLAIMEKAERDTYDQTENREPNAIRMWSVFCRRPQYAERIITEQLKKSYLPRLNPVWRRNYDILSGQIHEQISCFPDSELNKPLKETYLLGYYLQKNELYKSHKNDAQSDDGEQ